MEPRHKKRLTYLEKGGRRCSTHRRVEGVALHRHSYCHSSARRLLLHTFGISPLSSASFFLASKNFLADEREGGGGEAIRHFAAESHFTISGRRGKRVA